MASIKGVALKNVRKLGGCVCDSCVEASIWLDGERIGALSDTGCGGHTAITIGSADDEHTLKDRAEAFFMDYPTEYPNLDFFFSFVMALLDAEDYYKQSAKDGFGILVTENPLIFACVEDEPACAEGAYRLSADAPEPIVNACKKDLKNPCVYRGLDDFTIA